MQTNLLLTQALVRAHSDSWHQPEDCPVLRYCSRERTQENRQSSRSSPRPEASTPTPGLKLPGWAWPNLRTLLNKSRGR